MLRSKQHKAAVAAASSFRTWKLRQQHAAMSASPPTTRSKTKASVVKAAYRQQRLSADESDNSDVADSESSPIDDDDDDGNRSMTAEPAQSQQQQQQQQAAPTKRGGVMPKLPLISATTTAAELTLPKIKAVRFRLYDVVNSPATKDAATIRLCNKEGVFFSAPHSDIVLIGQCVQTKHVTLTQLSDLVRQLTGEFFWMRFRRLSDNQPRDMYALKLAEESHHTVAGNMAVRDLELDNTDMRQCRVENIEQLVWRGTCYIRRH